MRRIYLDFASATPVLPAVARAVYTALEEVSGNPSATHEEGRRAHDALQSARTETARALSVKPEELVFTSGGTESNNLAIRGVLRALKNRGIAYADMHIVTSTIEHASILEACALAEELGVRATYIKPAFDGIITPDSVLDVLTPETVLVSIAHVNSETGSVSPIGEIAHTLQRYKDRNVSKHKESVPEFSLPVLHTDAAQSPLYLDAAPHTLHADLVSYDAQKIQGPKGIGVLYRDFSVPIAAIMGGGTQERGVRPGTENVPGIIGAALAFKTAKEHRVRREERVRALRDWFIEKLLKEIPEAKLVGHPKRRIANNALFTIPNVDGEYLAVLMDKEGISVTPRSACGGSGGGYSHVVQELTGDSGLSKGTIRFSLGPETEEWELAEAVRALKKVLRNSQGAG
ncbi:cysteine desulfurase [Patescibacteria group bacterium]|nr:cysteine desulfurase [Patescibacteria group bacterium]